MKQIISNRLKTKSILKNILFSVVVILASYGITNAGNLFPSDDTVSSTFYTLGDIYDKLTDNTNSANEGDHDLTSSGTPTSTFHTLADIYGAIPTLDAGKIVTGTTYMGVVGSAILGADLSNMFNGTGQGITGGATSTGGVDDYNNAGEPPADRYQAIWTQCTLSNNYCGTGDSFAQAKDNNTNLIWALPCAEVGCSSNSTTTQTYYTWDNTGGDNNGMTAQSLCSSLGSDWYLPHQKQLMQVYIDGSYANLEFPGTYDSYWSATTLSSNTDGAWLVSLSFGYTVDDGKSGTDRVRCVRLAN